MKIAFYAPLKSPDHPVTSGDRTVARGLLAALRRAGHEVAIASRFRSFDAGDPARQERLGRIGSRMAGRIARRMEEPGMRPDIWFTYHLYHKAPDWLGPAVSQRLGLPYVVAEASFAPKQAGGAWDRGHRAVAAAIGQTDALFMLNPADAQCVAPLLASPDRLVPLPPFIDTQPFHRAAAVRNRDAIAVRFGLDAAQPWLLTVAMMRADQKLLSYRCLAAALAQTLDLPWRLLVVGGGPAEAAVRAAFAPIAGRIDFLGALDPTDLPPLYAAGDLYLWPAIKEAWSMAIVEAQAAGLAIVAGRSGGVPAVVAAGEAGLLVPEGDAAAFAGAVRRLLQDDEARRAMGAAAMRRMAREHDIAAAARRLDGHLRALLPVHA